jgi:hypothetical protein
VSAPGGKRETLTAGEGFVQRYEINQFRYFNLTLTRPSLQLWIATPFLYAMTKTADRGQGRPWKRGCSVSSAENIPDYRGIRDIVTQKWVVKLYCAKHSGQRDTHIS